MRNNRRSYIKYVKLKNQIMALKCMIEVKRLRKLIQILQMKQDKELRDCKIWQHLNIRFLAFCIKKSGN